MSNKKKIGSLFLTSLADLQVMSKILNTLDKEYESFNEEHIFHGGCGGGDTQVAQLVKWFVKQGFESYYQNIEW